MEQKAKFGWRNWLGVILIGFVGQLAWAIENQYINLWVYSQSGDSDYITWMTVASAVAATLTTFFMGALSDRLGKRKIFIAGGYVVWGVSLFLFGIMSRRNMEVLGGVANAFLLVGIMNTIVDVVMTFFGSTANDACFNAHVTDITNEHNRPKVESVISVLPLFATVAMLGVGMILGLPGERGSQDVSAFADQIATPWLYFFLIFGVITTLIGVASFFLIPKETIQPNREGSYLKNLIYGFRPSVVKKNPLFYIALLSFTFFNMAVDAFMPYYLVYFQDASGLGLPSSSFYLAMGLILVISSIVVIVFGLFMDKIGKLRLLIPGILTMAVGAVMLFFVKSLTLVIIGGILLMAGYLIGTAVLGAELRDQTPKKEVGLFQGVRMIGAVMLPMIIGSNISSWVFKLSGGTYINEYGTEATAPNAYMFIVTAVIAVLAIVPAIWLIKKSEKAKAASIEQQD